MNKNKMEMSKIVKGTEINNNIGFAIKENRIRNAITQSELSKVAGISQTYLSQIEGGEKVPRLRTLEKLALAINKKLTDLFEEAESTNKYNQYRMIHLLGKLSKSKDPEQLRKLQTFIESL